MRTIVTLSALAMICSVSFSQSIQNEVVASGGNYFENSSGSISFTIGEPVIETLENGNILTQGFQQPVLSLTEADEVTEIEIEMTAYPNPTRDRIILSFTESLDNDITYRVTSICGTTSATNTILKGTSDTEIDMSGFTSGSYVLTMVQGDKKVKTIQIELVK
jgi:hypothetical protein